MKPIGQYKDFKWKGSFRLEYKYIPQNYIISIDHEAGLFIILIDDGEKSSTNLERNSKEKKDELNAKNIDIAVRELKRVLDSNNFSLFFYEGEDLFEKKPDGTIIKLNDIFDGDEFDAE